MKPSSGRRWFVVAVFFVFMLLHQSDKLLIGTLTPNIMLTFGITMTEMGAVSTGALIVGAIFYPLWGYLYDRYGRAKLLALASFIWGATTWLNAVAPTFRSFLVTRASTGIDDSSYPGIYSLVADYFPPRMRGKVYGILQLTMPLGFLSGMVLALALRDTIGWRGVFYITGTLGVLLAAVIFFGVREAPRGGSEPELEGLETIQTYRFSWQTARGLFSKPTLRLLFAQGFFGVFPWNVITFWFFTYLEKERGYTGTSLFVTMGLAVLVLAAGYPVGGALGDALFRRDPRASLRGDGRRPDRRGADVLHPLRAGGEPEPLPGDAGADRALHPVCRAQRHVHRLRRHPPRGAQHRGSIQYFIESAGAALSPLIAGFIADRYSLHIAILAICVSTWLICGVFFGLIARVLPKDIGVLRGQMQERARRERAVEPAGQTGANPAVTL